jgi:hypothetical protein
LSAGKAGALGNPARPVIGTSPATLQRGALTGTISVGKAGLEKSALALTEDESATMARVALRASRS